MSLKLIDFRGALRTDADWKNVYNKTEKQIRKDFDHDLAGVFKSGLDFDSKLKLRMWIRYVGPLKFYDLKLRSEFRRMHPITLTKNMWKEISVIKLGDTWRGIYGAEGKHPDKAERIWTDIRHILREKAGKDHFQVTLEDPKQEVIAPDKNYEIKGVDPRINSTGLTMNDCIDAISDKFGIELKIYDFYKEDLIQLWVDLIEQNGVLSQEDIGAYKKPYRKDGEK
ncbi:MAG: hypothetical protein V3V19_11330 [Cocleimonas sp.]